MAKQSQPSGATIMLGAPGAKSFAHQIFMLTMYLAPFLALAAVVLSCVYIALGNNTMGTVDKIAVSTNQMGGKAQYKLNVSETFAFLALGTALAHYHWGKQ